MHGALAGVISSHAPAAPPASGITIGSIGTLTYSGSNAGEYTFSPGPTIDGGAAKLLLIAVWATAFGQKDNNHDGDPTTFTLNGNPYDQLLFRFLQNTSTNKYIQAVGAIWDAPTSGDVVFNMFSSITATGCGVYFMNLSNLHASPLGVLEQEHFGTGTALEFTALTTASNSLLVAINGCRRASNTFAFDDSNFTPIGGSYGTASAADGTWRVGYRNGLAVDTYNCGGDWSVSEADRIAGGAFELKGAS